jgi:hypothetical protein
MEFYWVTEHRTEKMLVGPNHDHVTHKAQLQPQRSCSSSTAWCSKCHWHAVALRYSTGKYVTAQSSGPSPAHLQQQKCRKKGFAGALARLQVLQQLPAFFGNAPQMHLLRILARSTCKTLLTEHFTKFTLRGKGTKYQGARTGSAEVADIVALLIHSL